MGFAEGSVSSAFLFVVAAVAVTVNLPAKAMQTDRGGGDPYPAENFRAFGKPSEVDEGKAIKPIDLPFLQHIDDWERPGHGISMSSMGEPKSGTTWTERIITDLALELCGSSTNTWCKMGGLRVIPNVPDPSYRWEMVHADTGELFIHFDGKIKHSIPGLQVGDDCNPRGRAHSRAFGAASPCIVNVMINRESIKSCLPITSEECLKRMPSRDPSVRRTTVVFRDPRDIVISERRMRAEVFGRGNVDDIPLVPFINKRFKRIVSWQLVRWVWHTTVYNDESYIMLYEDLQGDSKALIDLASFMGLECSEEQAYTVWAKHRNQSPHGRFDSYDLPEETVKFMNATMLDLLPYEMIYRYKPTLMST